MATMSDTDSIERGFQRLSSIFKPPVLDAHKCYRCKDTVYHAEKMGPVQSVIYHKKCFKCVVCDNHLTMKNYFTSQVDADDRELYCANHYPRVGAARYGHGAIGISGAVRAQENFRKMSKKLDQQVRKPGTVRIPSYDANAIAIKRILTSPKAAEYTAAVNAQTNVSLPPDAMGIKGPLAAQRLQHNPVQTQPGHMYQPKVNEILFIHLNKKNLQNSYCGFLKKDSLQSIWFLCNQSDFFAINLIFLLSIWAWRKRKSSFYVFYFIGYLKALIFLY